MSAQLSFLLDTNVIIQLEEVGPDRRIKSQFQKLHALLTEYSLPFTYHPLTENDLKNDKDKERLGEMISRLKKYPQLSNPPIQDGKELEKLYGGISNPNDLIDCQLLFAINRNCATYLVTEDKRIHKRANNANLDERVLYVGDVIDLITRQYQPETVQLPNVNHEYLYNLDLSIPFFDSLKADYSEFENWIRNNAKRRCWTIKVDGDLAGLCIYKYDEEEEHKGILMPSMKLCTFKVSDNHNNRKFGELLLKMAHTHAVKNNIAAIWVTADGEKQVRLIQFLKKFGFFVHRDLKNKDMVFYKLMVPPEGLPLMEPLDFYRHYSPHFYDDDKIKKYIIPIRSNFHDILYPEAAPQLSLGGINMSQSVPGNTIRKVYLSHSPTRELPTGSLIYFYRSSPEQYIQTLGIVERSRRLSDMESLAAAIGKRSVYSKEQVAEMIKKEVLVIDFRLVAHSEEPIPLAELVTTGVFNSRPPQSITEINDKRYNELKKLWQSRN